MGDDTKIRLEKRHVDEATKSIAPAAETLEDVARKSRSEARAFVREVRKVRESGQGIPRIRIEKP